MDPRTRRKNGFVITGGLLTAFAFLGSILERMTDYQAAGCGEGNLITIFGSCYFIWKILAAMLAIGIILVLWGLSRYVFEDRDPTRHLRHTALDNFLLAFLLAWPVTAGIAMLVQQARQESQGIVFAIELGGHLFEQVFLLQVAVVLGFLLLLPFAYSYFSQTVRSERMIGEIKQHLQPTLEGGWVEAEVLPEAHADAGDEAAPEPPKTVDEADATEAKEIDSDEQATEGAEESDDKPDEADSSEDGWKEA